MALATNNRTELGKKNTAAKAASTRALAYAYQTFVR
jgi:hypothetical protein